MYRLIPRWPFLIREKKSVLRNCTIWGTLEVPFGEKIEFVNCTFEDGPFPGFTKNQFSIIAPEERVS